MASSILHVGEDVCRRIPVMETAGFVVFQCKVEIPAIDSAFEQHKDYSAVVFQNDIAAVPENVVATIRSHCEAPLVLFQNPTISSNDEGFDLVIPALTAPDVWLRKLNEAIQTSGDTRERSRRLRSDCADVRSGSQSLRPESSTNRNPLIDADALWRGNDAAGVPRPKPPEEVRPEKLREKAG